MMDPEAVVSVMSQPSLTLGCNFLWFWRGTCRVSFKELKTMYDAFSRFSVINHG